MSIMMNLGRVTYNLGSMYKLPPGEGRTFLIDDIAIAIFRTRTGEVFATQASCPHKGGPLADGIIGDGKLCVPCMLTNSIWQAANRLVIRVRRSEPMLLC